MITMASHNIDDLAAKVGDLCAAVEQHNAHMKGLMEKIFDQTLRTNLRLHDMKNRVKFLQATQEELTFECSKVVHRIDEPTAEELKRQLKKRRLCDDRGRPIDETNDHPDYGDILDKTTLQMGSEWASSERLKLV